MRSLSLRLRAAPLFATTAEALLDRLAATATTAHFAEGERLWWTGEAATCVAVVERGLVRAVRQRPDGSEECLALIGPLEAIALPAVLEHGSYPADAIAMSSRVEVIRVPADAFRQAITQDPALMTALNLELLNHTKKLRSKILIVAAGSIAARLAMLLLYLADNFGTHGAAGRVHVPLALSRAAMAGFVSARVETVIRVLSTWRTADWVRTTSEGFDLELEALHRVAEQG